MGKISKIKLPSGETFNIKATEAALNEGSTAYTPESGDNSTKIATTAFVQQELSDKQDILISGENIKTINGNNILGYGNVELSPTYSQIITGLGYIPLDGEEKGVANGLATLDSLGKVTSSQLPSYVDDVIEGYYYEGNFYYDYSHTQLITPESGKIYIDIEYTRTYRWSGSVYIEISSSLTLGETEHNAYRGDRGKEAYDHSLVVSGNPHNVTKSDLNLSNVENKSSAEIRSEITTSNISSALGYIPYSSANPNNYVSQSTNTLTNYFTKTEVEGMVGNRFQALIVETLPASGISTNTIYMILQSGQSNIYDEWMYISNAWIKIGTTSIDMSEYAKISNLHSVATTGSYASLVGKPDIPTDTSELTNSAGFITKDVNNLSNYTSTENLADVAISGDYNDLENTPGIPTNISQLTNDSNYIRVNDLPTTNISSLRNDVPYATLNDVKGLEDIDVEEIKKAIAAMEHIGTVTQVTAGTGLTGGGNTSVTLNHSNDVTPVSGYPVGTTLVNGGSFTVRDTQYDSEGHITGSQDRVITMTEIPPYDDTEVRSLISDEVSAREDTDLEVAGIKYNMKNEFTAFVFCIFGIEPYIDPNTMEIIPDRYYLRSDVDTGIFMDNQKIDIHLKAWLKYHYDIDDLDKLKNVTCYVYAMGDHGEYVNHMVTFWSQMNNPRISSYPHLQQVGSFIDDGYGSVHRFTTTQVGAILSSNEDGYITADPTGTGKGYVTGWNNLKGSVGNLSQLQTTSKDSLVNAINETFTSVSNGKATVASAVTDKGVPTSSDATFNTIANNIRQIETGITPTGNIQLTKATSTDVTQYATATVQTGSATTPATTIAQNSPTFTLSGNTVTASVAQKTQNVTPTVSAGWVSSGTSGRITLNASSSTYTIPTETATAVDNGVITPSANHFLTQVTVNVPYTIYRTGTGVPDPLLGNNGDLYVDLGE